MHVHEHRSRRFSEPEAVPDDRANEKAGIDPRLLMPADRGKLGEDARNLIANRALEVVNGALDAASRGNYQVMKYLFEEAGVFSSKPAGSQPEGCFSVHLLDECHARHQGHSFDAARCTSNQAASASAVK